MLTANPSRYSALVDSEGYGGELLGAEMLHQAQENIVHAVHPYGNSHTLIYGNTDLQRYGCSRNTLQMEFKDRLKAARKHAGLSQEELAAATPLTQTSISDLERGKSKGTTYVAQLARACGVDTTWLAEGKGEMLSGLLGEDAAEYGATSSDIVREMLRKHGKGLSEEARQRIQAAAVDQLEVPADRGNVVTADFSRPGAVGDEIRIPHYDVRAAMGGGQIPADYVELLQDVTVSQDHLRRLGVDYESPYHLKMITGWGQSMAPTIQDKDPLLIDVSIDEYTGDGIYLFNEGEYLFIKRLQLADAERFEVISDNEKHKDRQVRKEDIYIRGRILLVWNAHRL